MLGPSHWLDEISLPKGVCHHFWPGLISSWVCSHFFSSFLEGAILTHHQQKSKKSNTRPPPQKGKKKKKKRVPWVHAGHLIGCEKFLCQPLFFTIFGLG
jgi:hypothetical protein